MYTIITTILIAIISFIGGMYCEKVNSKTKIAPIKKAFSSINDSRTIVIDRKK